MKTKRFWVATLFVAAACSGDPKRFEGFGAAGSGSGSGSGSGNDSGTGPASNGEGECAQYNVRSELTIPEMLIVLDRSGSMAPEGNDRMTDRWGGSRSAVIEVTNRFEDDIDFGLVTFPGPGAQAGAGLPGRGGGRGGNVDAAANCTTGTVNVEVGEHHAGEIAQVLNGMGTAGFTPTAATLQGTRAAIIGAGPSDQTVVPPKYLMLVTDGDPNCSGDFTGPLTADAVAEQDTVNAISGLHAEGVQTFVVGFQTGDTAFASVLDQMAVAGGTGDMRHHSVESGEDLKDTFEDLIGRALSCSYRLGNRISDPAYVLVTVAGKTRQYQNAADGWTLGPDMQTITLTGGACEAVQKGASFRVEVTCEPIIGI